MIWKVCVKFLGLTFMFVSGLAVALAAIKHGWGDSFFESFRIVGVSISIAAGAFLMMYLDIKKGTLSSQKVANKTAITNSQINTELPFAELYERFLKLEKIDETATADLQSGFLGWKSQSYSDIQIIRTIQNDWIAVFWTREDTHLTSSQILTIGSSHKITIPECIRKIEPHGMVVYQRNVLFVYPSTLVNDFQESFLATILAPEHEFSLWFDEYYASSES